MSANWIICSTGMTVETLGADFDSRTGRLHRHGCGNAVLGPDYQLRDTSLAHLAGGALGRPTWLALFCASEWRWLFERSDSPWYPTMTLFRQAIPGDWASVFAQMEEKLTTLLKNG